MDRIAALEFLLREPKPIGWDWDKDPVPGTLWSWGYNSHGQLGRTPTTTYPYNKPGPVGEDSDWQQVAGGGSHTLAIKQDGTLWSWGDNTYGELGRAVNTANPATRPGQVGTASDWQQVSCGVSHTLAIKQNGTLWSWGNNGLGQLGRVPTTTYPANRPGPVGVDSDWFGVFCGANNTFAIKGTGTFRSLWAWGYNAYFALGLGGYADNEFRPQRVGLSTDWLQVDGGMFHALAIKSDGTLWSWGNNENGQLGLDHFDHKSSPQRIGFKSDWSSITCGLFHNVSIKSDGTMWSWGLNNEYGALGLGNAIGRVRIPLQIGVESDWKRVTSFSAHTLAIKADGTLWSWGNNSQGQLGVGDVSHKFSPTEVGLDSNWQQATCGGHHTLSIKFPT